MIFINKGDAPLSLRQAINRGIQHVERELGKAGARKGDQVIFGATAHSDLPARLIAVLAGLPNAPATYPDYAAGWESDNVQNGINNLFNHQLAAYKTSVARLARYRLADGQEEETAEEETGEFDEQGNPITHTVIVKRLIEPLDAEIEQPVYDENTGEQIGTEMVPNPLIIQDDAERAKAQTIVDGLPSAVISFANIN